jgi:hypothetical protein
MHVYTLPVMQVQYCICVMASLWRTTLVLLRNVTPSAYLCGFSHYCVHTAVVIAVLPAHDLVLVVYAVMHLVRGAAYRHART